MKYALFLGCNIPARVVQFETAARAVMRQVGIQLVDIRDFKCCGYPVRNLDQKAFLLSASENLAWAEKFGLNIMTLCKCCFGSLKEAEHFLKEEGDLQEEIKNLLAEKGMQYEGKAEVKHFLSVLYHDVGLDTIESNISNAYEGLKIATHYGCHALRPSDITQFDDPVAPSPPNPKQFTPDNPSSGGCSVSSNGSSAWPTSFLLLLAVLLQMRFRRPRSLP